MNHPQKSVQITFVFFILNAIFWLFYALTTAFGGTHLTTVPGVIKWVMIILAIGSSAALIGTAILLRKRNRFAFYFGLVILSILAILSITDEFGLLDIFSLLISIIPIGLMLRDRVWYTTWPDKKTT